MAKYKHFSYDRQLMIPITLKEQILPDTFEYTLNQVRKRDIRFNDVGKYKKRRTAKWKPKKGKRYFMPADFHLDEMTGKLICPAGNPMKLKSRNFVFSDGLKGTSYMGYKQYCMTYKLRSKCLRKKMTKFRQVILFEKVENFSTKMRNKFDTPYARSIYSRRPGRKQSFLLGYATKNGNCRTRLWSY